MEIAAVVVLWCLLWLALGAVWLVKMFFRWVCTFERAKPLPRPLPPAKEPSADDNVQEIVRAYHANCARILASPLDAGTKETMLQAEHDELARRMAAHLE